MPSPPAASPAGVSRASTTWGMVGARPLLPLESRAASSAARSREQASIHARSSEGLEQREPLGGRGRLVGAHQVERVDPQRAAGAKCEGATPEGGRQRAVLALGVEDEGAAPEGELAEQVGLDQCALPPADLAEDDRVRVGQPACRVQLEGIEAEGPSEEVGPDEHAGHRRARVAQQRVERAGLAGGGLMGCGPGRGTGLRRPHRSPMVSGRLARSPEPWSPWHAWSRRPACAAASSMAAARSPSCASSSAVAARKPLKRREPWPSTSSASRRSRCSASRSAPSIGQEPAAPADLVVGGTRGARHLGTAKRGARRDGLDDDRERERLDAEQQRGEQLGGDLVPGPLGDPPGPGDGRRQPELVEAEVAGEGERVGVARTRLAGALGEVLEQLVAAQELAGGVPGLLERAEHLGGIVEQTPLAPAAKRQVDDPDGQLGRGGLEERAI